jgi:ComF family protein
MGAAFLQALLTEILDLWAPVGCAACNSPYPTFPPMVPVMCTLCAHGLEPASEPPPGVLVPLAYGGPLARAIHRAKWSDTPATARALGTLLAHQLAGQIPAADVVIPVPLHGRRLAVRGFNQAVEMARSLGPPLALNTVLRRRDTPSQRGLGRNERLANVHNAFVPIRSDALTGLRVLIVDDVVTTGATLTEVASAARSAGAVQVTCVALARAALESGGTSLQTMVDAPI